jgi:hypothetical protein
MSAVDVAASDDELSELVVLASELVDDELLLSVDVDDELLPQPTSPATIEVARNADNNFFFIKNPPII